MKKWFRLFKEGKWILKDGDRSWRSLQVNKEEILEAIEVNLHQPCLMISADSNASKSSIFRTLEAEYFKNIFDNWVTNDQRNDQMKTLCCQTGLRLSSKPRNRRPEALILISLQQNNTFSGRYTTA